MLSSGLLRSYTHIVHIYASRQNIHTHKIKEFIIEKKKWRKEGKRKEEMKGGRENRTDKKTHSYITC